MKMHNDSFVGFTAWKQTTQQVQAGDIIVFDGLILNEGGFYDTRFNWFQCPFNGVYFVSSTLCSDDSNIGYTYGTMKKDDVSLFPVYVLTQDNPYTSSSNSGLVRCVASERIWMEASGSGSVYGQQGIHYSTFTIFMVNQDEGMTVDYIFRKCCKTSSQRI